MFDVLESFIPHFTNFIDKSEAEESINFIAQAYELDSSSIIDLLSTAYLEAQTNLTLKEMIEISTKKKMKR